MMPPCILVSVASFSLGFWRFERKQRARLGVLGRKLRNGLVSAPVAALIVLLSGAQMTDAADVTLEWDPNREEDIAGYKLRYGVGSGTYTEVRDAGSQTECTVSGLNSGTRYRFVVTAYNREGIE